MGAKRTGHPGRSWPKAERLFLGCFATKRTLILARRSAVSGPNQPVTEARATTFPSCERGGFLHRLQTCPEVRERQHLDCGLRTDLDGAAARYAEILARVVSSASEPDEQPPPPARHLRFRRRPQGPSGEEEGGAHHVEGHALGTGSNERPRHVRLLHKSEAKGHTGK